MIVPLLGELDELAVTFHELFQSYRRAGFSHKDALELVKAHIAAQTAAGLAQQDQSKGNDE